MNKIIQLIDSINKGIRIVLAVSLGTMSVVIIAQVISRYFFHHSFTWAEELSRYLMVLSVFLGAALALRTHSLIAVEVLAENISKAKKRVLKIIVYLLCLTFFVTLLVVGISMVDDVSRQLSPALQIKMSIPYLAIPIGRSALILNSIAVLLELIMNKNTEENKEAL